MRATESDLRAIVDTDTTLNVTVFLRTANVLTDKVEDKDTDSTLSAKELKEIEIYLAAHFYSHRDQLYKSRSTDNASGTFQGTTAMGLDSTQYGQTAQLIDSTGYLSQLEQQKQRQESGIWWLGITDDAAYPST